MAEPPVETTMELSAIVHTATLRNGVQVMIRPLLPSDRDAVASGFQLLSERSRFLRFLTGKGTLSESSLRALVDEVDQHRHVALAMFWMREDEDPLLVGVGRFVSLPHDPATADVAVTIADQLHGLGAGTIMMRALADRARVEGVRRFMATMTADNVASHRMMRGSGTVVRDEVVDDLREIDVALS